MPTPNDQPKPSSDNEQSGEPLTREELNAAYNNADILTDVFGNPGVPHAPETLVMIAHGATILDNPGAYVGTENAALPLRPRSRDATWSDRDGTATYSVHILSQDNLTVTRTTLDESGKPNSKRTPPMVLKPDLDPSKSTIVDRQSQRPITRAAAELVNAAGESVIAILDQSQSSSDTPT